MGFLDDAIREHLDLKRRRGADPAEIEKAEREALGPVRRQTPLASFPDEAPLTAFSDEHPAAAWDEPEPQASRPAKRRRLLHRRSSEKDALLDHASDTAAPAAADDFRAYEREFDDADAHVHQHPLDYSQESASPGSPNLEPLGPDHSPFGPEDSTFGPDHSPFDPHDSTFGPDHSPFDPHDSTFGPDHSAFGDPEVPSALPPDPARGTDRNEEHGETIEYDVEGALQQAGAEDDVLEETPEFLQDTPDHDRLWFEQRPPRDFDFDG